MPLSPIRPGTSTPLRRPRGAKDIRAISAHAGCDPRTTVAAYAGLAQAAKVPAIARAAEALGFVAPPPPETEDAEARHAG